MKSRFWEIVRSVIIIVVLTGFVIYLNQIGTLDSLYLIPLLPLGSIVITAGQVIVFGGLFICLYFVGRIIWTYVDDRYI